MPTVFQDCTVAAESVKSRMKWWLRHETTSYVVGSCAILNSTRFVLWTLDIDKVKREHCGFITYTLSTSSRSVCNHKPPSIVPGQYYSTVRTCILAENDASCTTIVTILFHTVLLASSSWGTSVHTVPYSTTYILRVYSSNFNHPSAIAIQQK